MARTMDSSTANGGAMFKNLVVALDLEADGDRALPVVQALASGSSARVDLVTVASPGMPTAADAYELEGRARRHGWDCDSWTIVHDIDAADGLLQHVARLEDPLIVMATDARAPWTSPIVGSVTHDVPRRTNRPVLLVGPRVPWWWTPRETTLLACVAWEDAARAIAPITSWQETFAAPRPVLAEVVSDVDQATPARRHLTDVADLLAAQGVHPDAEVLHGDDPVVALEAAADRLLGAVYVATSARYTDGRLHWHSTTRDLVRRAARPVLVVPARPAPLPLRASRSTVERVAFRDTTIAA
jgi:nucleotide-binding universal stress UspA family protein